MRPSSRSPSRSRRSPSRPTHRGLPPPWTPEGTYRCCTASEPARRTVAETSPEIEDDVLDEDAPSSYSTSTPETRGGGSSITAPGAATGRRKEAIARVRLIPGSGTWRINGRTLEDYFPNKVHQQLVNDPFKVTDLEGRFDVIARIHGGGASGQAGALRLGVARALNEIDVDANRPTLKKAGFLTRDARVKERKKAGLKKARKAPQYSKR